MQIRPATAADFLTYLGELPPYRVRAWVGEVDGRIVGIAGIAYPPGRPPIAWADLTDDARKYAKTLHKTVKTQLATMQVGRMVASASHDIPASRRWLERLGFTDTGKQTDTGDLYVHDPHSDPHRYRDAS